MFNMKHQIGVTMATLCITMAVVSCSPKLINRQSGAAGAIAGGEDAVDVTAPTSPSVSVNAGVQSTQSSSVTLTLSATDTSTPMEMCIAENGTCAGCTYETYATTKAKVIGGAHGLITYSAKFKDSAGNESSCVTDTIYYETVSVNPLYSIAPDWNDYAKASDTTTACTGAESTSTLGCYHGGELRRATTAETSCVGLSLADNLGVFDWTCSVVNGVAVFDSSFKRSKYLSDLITGAGPTWKNVQVTLTGGSGGTSISRTWWSNTLTALPDNSATSVTELATAGTIYVLNSSRNTYGYNINADRVGLVVMPGFTLTMTAATKNCSLVTGEVDGTANVCVISAGSQYFLWIEGWVNGNAFSDIATYLASTKYSKVMNYKAQNSLQSGFGLRSSERIYVTDANIANNTQRGIKLLTSTYNVFNRVNSYNNTLSGISLDTSNDNSFVDIVSSANISNGIELTSTSKRNRLVQVTSINNSSYGIAISSSSDSNIVHQALSMNSSRALYISSSDSETVSQFATQRPIELSTSSSNKFTGNLLFSAAVSCTEAGGTNPGLTNTTCANNGLSNANQVASLAFTASMYGKASSDTATTEDTAGSAAFASVTNWLDLENQYRWWGINGSAFANADHRGACVAAGTCRIWDATIAVGDTKLRNKSNDASTNNSAFSAGAACPAEVNGDIAVTNSNGTTWLKNASEIVGDNIGNDDGLCEASEACLYNPNFGAYQGHGTLSSCTFVSSGGLTGITIVGYGTNGR